MSLVELSHEHVEVFTIFLAQLPDSDLTFVKEPVGDLETIRTWAAPEAPGARWLATDGDAVTGFVEVLPLLGWCDHVGEIRLVVRPDRRGQGIGRDLARCALLQGTNLGLTKLIVELRADQEALLSMFQTIGFTGEALLRDHIRDRNGKRLDLIMLAHFLDATNSDLDALGLSADLSDGGA